MREIRRLTDEAQLVEYARICANAYPGEKADLETIVKHFRETAENNPSVGQWGVFVGSTMVGGMVLLDLEMNYFGRFIPAGGLGLVAVDQVQRKRGAAMYLVH
ncbi:MAG: GNAT family N-acetyltransferase, partial [Bacillota bacterium]